MSELARHALEGLRHHVTDRVGIDVDAGSSRVVEAITSRARATGVSADEYLAGQLYRADLDALVRELTVGETYFFRHGDQLAALFQDVLRDRLASGHRPVRIASAGCSTGEEPYSIAIGIREAGFDCRDFEIHAFDINDASLARARAGRYSPWALRETSPERVAAWFTREGRDLVLSPDIRASVTFDRRNLLAPASWPAAFYDVVLCRNVLMYFAPAAMLSAVAQIAASLRSGGFLFLGHAETLSRAGHALDVCHTHGAFYYRRRDDGHVASDATGWDDAIARSSKRLEHLEARVLGPHSVIDTGVPEPADVIARAMVNVELGRFEEAQDLCHHADGHDAGAAEHILSLCAEATGALDEALLHAHHAVVLDPALAMAWVHLGLLAQRTGDVALARVAMPRAIDALGRDDEARVAMFGGGFRRDALIAVCEAQLVALGGAS